MWFLLGGVAVVLLLLWLLIFCICQVAAWADERAQGDPWKLE